MASLPPTSRASAFQRSLVLHQISSGIPGIDVIQCLVHYPRPLGVDTVRRNLIRLLDEEPALRVAFDTSDLLNPALLDSEISGSAMEPLVFKERSCSGDLELRGLKLSERRAPFDFSKPPLFSVVLLNGSSDAEQMLLTAHSALLDPASVRSLAWRLSWAGPEPCPAPSALRTAPTPPGPGPETALLEAYWRAWLSDRTSTPVTGDSAWGNLAFSEPMDVVELDFSPSCLELLRRFEGEWGVPLETVAELGWAALVSRLSRSETTQFGSWIDGAGGVGSGGLGVRGNLLPRRVVLKREAALLELLVELRESRRAGAIHGDVSMAQLSEWGGLKGHETLFDSMVRCFRGGQADVPSANVTLELREQMAVNLCGTLHPESGKLAMSYRAGQVPTCFAKAWISMWRAAIEGMLLQPRAKLAALDLTDPSMKAAILREEASKRRTYPGPSVVHDLVASSLSAHPNVDAVIEGDRRMLYGELDRFSARVAAVLRRAGVGRDDRVAVCLGRTLAMPGVVLGVLRAGAAYVPLDPAYPRDRIERMVAQSAPKAVITNSQWMAKLGPWPVLTLRVEMDFSEQASLGPPASPGADSESLAYVLFTSGSTGVPKGVAMRHHALANLIQWQAGESGRREPGARTLQFASLNFDVSFQEIFSTWFDGGTLVMVDEEQRRDPSALWDLIESRRVERLFLPFVALHQLAEEGERRSTLPVSLKEVITAGEQLQSSPQLRAMFRRLPGCVLVNQYGPSETHVATAFRVPADPESWPPLPPIGRPIANARAWVLDADRRLVPAGVPGEIFLGGDCLARGYLDNPSATEDRFEWINLPGEVRERFYRTGDLGRLDPDGNLEFLGRCDHQVKIRGYRVELGEIEVTLLKHPAVQACVVHPTGNGAVRSLTAYVASSNPRDGLDRALRAHLQSSLPEYMVPAAFVFLDKLPLTSSGKVDRRALPVVAAIRANTPAPGPLPQDPMQSRLVEIWRELLPGVEFGVSDRFFDLGGTSLLAVRMQRHIEATLGFKIKVALIFQNPTVLALSAALREFHQPGSGIRGEVSDRAARQREAMHRARAAASNRSLKTQP